MAAHSITGWRCRCRVSTPSFTPCPYRLQRLHPATPRSPSRACAPMGRAIQTSCLRPTKPQQKRRFVSAPGFFADRCVVQTSSCSESAATSLWRFAADHSPVHCSGRCASTASFPLTLRSLSTLRVHCAPSRLVSRQPLRGAVPASLTPRSHSRGFLPTQSPGLR